MKGKHLIFIWWNEPKWGREQDRMRGRRERLKIDWLQSVSKHFVYWCIYLLPTQAWRRQFCHSGTDVPCGLGSNVLWWMGSRWEGGHSSMLSVSLLRLCWLSLRPGAISFHQSPPLNAKDGQQQAARFVTLCFHQEWFRYSGIHLWGRTEPPPTDVCLPPLFVERGQKPNLEKAKIRWDSESSS